LVPIFNYVIIIVNYYVSSGFVIDAAFPRLRFNTLECLRTGSIGIGADADIAIWDPNISYTLTHDLIQDGSDYTPYEGFELTGRPVLTMSRGKVIMRDGALVGDKGHGVYLPRTRSPYASTVR
jgi:N-acyl-D-aspartate/D-glutamate deacylase